MVVTVSLWFGVAAVARADVAPPPDQSCDGLLEGAECGLDRGCETGTCQGAGDSEVECQLHCVDFMCRQCPPPDDAGPDHDADEDTTPIYTSNGGCNMGSTRASAFAPWLVALIVPFLVLGLRRRRR